MVASLIKWSSTHILPMSNSNFTGIPDSRFISTSVYQCCCVCLAIFFIYFHTEFYFAWPTIFCFWLGPLLCICQSWQVNKPHKLILQAPSYAVSPLDLQPAYANIIHRPQGFMGVGKWYLPYPEPILCLWYIIYLNLHYDLFQPKTGCSLSFSGM